jgi:hypothetical protein
MLILLLELLLMFGTLPVALAAPLDDLVAAAKKEGVIEPLAPSSTDKRERRRWGTPSTRSTV